MKVNAENGLNLRNQPTSNSEIITKLINNEKVKITEVTDVKLTVKDYDSKGNFLGNITDNWVKLKTIDRAVTIEGYAFKGYLKALGKASTKKPLKPEVKDYIEAQIKKGGGGSEGGCF